jgi:hypothetical protein
MCLAAKDALIRTAERAHAALDLLDQPKGRPTLSLPGVLADRAVQADFGQRLVAPGWFLSVLVSHLGT